MLAERVHGEIGVSFDHVNDYRPPGDDVALLGLLVQVDEAANDVRAESESVSSYPR